MRQKYEREIEEILLKFDKPRGREPLPRRVARDFDRWRQHVSLPKLSFTPATLMIAALGLAILTFPLRWTVPQLIGTVSTVSLILFALALVLMFTNRNRSGSQMWRGRPVDVYQYRYPSSPGPIATAWKRFNRWRRTRHWRGPVK